MLLGFIIIVLVVWGLIYFFGRLLPVEYTVEKSEYFEAPPSMMWSIIMNHLKERDWRNDLIEVAKLPNQGDKQVWKEVRVNKKTYILKTLGSEAPKYLEREIIDNKKQGGVYHYEIEQEGKGSRLKVKHISKVYSSFERVKLFLSPSTKFAYVNQYLSDVKQRVLHLSDEE